MSAGESATLGPDAPDLPRLCSQIWKSWRLSLHALSTTWIIRASPISFSSTPVSEVTIDSCSRQPGPP